MPNNVTTRCGVSGPKVDLDRFFEAHVQKPQGENQVCFDFETIIPIPECIRNTEASSNAEEGLFALLGVSRATQSNKFGPRTMEEYLRASGWYQQGVRTQEELRTWLEENRPRSLAAGRAAVKAIEETGCRDWYDWKIQNWGTSGTSYSFTQGRPEEFCFVTAWSFPTPIFKKLIELFPTLSFHCYTYDEGSCFAGEGVFQAGTEIPDMHGEATKELYEIVYERPYPDEDEDEDE